MSGDRRQVREAIASYFGGTAGDPAQGIYYQNGPLTSLNLGTAYPHTIKPLPDQAFTAGLPAGSGWGAVMAVHLGESPITRAAVGGPTGGWRERLYRVTCSFEALSYEPFLEVASAGLDDLVDGFLDLIYADRTLGTTDPVLYPPPVNRLITEAGEGDEGIVLGPPSWETSADRSKSRGGIAVTFTALTMVAS